MEIPQTQRKLRETKFFLRHLQLTSGKASGEEEHFHFYLSAFLSAAKSVDYILQNEQGGKYKKWFPKWKASLSKKDCRFIEFMFEKRGSEVHGAGAEHFIEKQPIPVYDVYEDAAGRIEVFSPPAKLMSGPPATVYKHKWFFNLGGQRQEVLEICTKFVNMLEKIVREFCETQEDD
jgi:hypothetical protein